MIGSSVSAVTSSPSVDVSPIGFLQRSSFRRHPVVLFRLLLMVFVFSVVAECGVMAERLWMNESERRWLQVQWLWCVRRYRYDGCGVSLLYRYDRLVRMSPHVEVEVCGCSSNKKQFRVLFFFFSKIQKNAKTPIVNDLRNYVEIALWQ